MVFVMTDPTSRRPLSSRDTAWAKMLAQRLVATEITPNQISQASIAFAAMGAVLYALSIYVSGLLLWMLLVLAAGMCQMRLLCNLLDGMVAIEGGKSAKDGPFWNEVPDRAADFLLLAGAGVAGGNVVLGLVAAALAIATAYIRELGRAEGLPPDFSGPMAKPHRMAALTIGTVLAAFSPFGFTTTGIISATLLVIALGTAATIVRRSLHLIRALNAR
jgi:phosphatidylglycerophosphate synthase